MIKKKTIIIFSILWLSVSALFISCNNNILKIYPFGTLLFIILLSFKYTNDLGKYLQKKDYNLYKEIIPQGLWVNGFGLLKFIFTNSDNHELHKVKNTGKIVCILSIILFISLPIMNLVF